MVDFSIVFCMYQRVSNEYPSEVVIIYPDHIWLVVLTILKNMSSSMGKMTSTILQDERMKHINGIFMMLDIRTNGISMGIGISPLPSGNLT